jgi:cytochrome c oxidase subunit 3
MSSVSVRDMPERKALPVGSPGERSSGWWGCLTLIATEGALFSYLIASYLYLAVQTPTPWPPEGMPKLGLGVINTLVLLSSSVVVWYSEYCVRRSNTRRGTLALGLAIVLGVIFVAIQLREWANHPYGIRAHLYGSLYFTITGFHMAHVVVGLIVLAFLMLWTALGYFDSGRNAALRIGGLYWHFVDVVWLLIFSTLYLSPYVLRRP